MKNLTRSICLLIALTVAVAPVLAGRKGNQPCSKKKGGIARCSNGKYVCKDGSISQSKSENWKIYESS